ncbi:Uncharacterised protein [BD1-7 clade bacterium]|uniref:Uncharacterized protein n=1 Tax=BD1-7 clade bacterium TaxID=2029982 RepID=A0A5S9PUS1_9GAMM|nr:Uncharacterised protein [BD1-7 clade bacterium]
MSANPSLTLRQCDKIKVQVESLCDGILTGAQQSTEARSSVICRLKMLFQPTLLTSVVCVKLVVKLDCRLIGQCFDCAGHGVATEQ